MNILEDFKKALQEFIDLDDEYFVNPKTVEGVRETINDSFLELEENIDAMSEELSLSPNDLTVAKRQYKDTLAAMKQQVDETCINTSENKSAILNYILEKTDSLVTKLINKSESKQAKVYFELLNEAAKIPVRAHEEDAGADIYSNEEIVIKAHEYGIKVHTGFKMVLPKGWEAQIRPRSGMSKTPIRISNAPGTVDSNYRGEVCVLVDNISNDDYTIKLNDRIAQMVVKRCDYLPFEEIDSVDFSPSDRAEDGFGSTGR